MLARSLAYAAVLLLCTLGSCLPESEPGIGQRVLPGRGFANLRAGAGEDRPLFFTFPSARMQPGESAFDLYVLRPGQVAPELLVPGAAGPPVFDARGRVYVQHTPAKDVRQLRQIDLVTGAPRELGPITRLSLSPGATQLVLARPDRRLDSLTMDGVLRELPATASSAMRFVGEDVCWVDEKRLDCALAEGGPPVHPTDLQVLKLLPLRTLSFREGRQDVLIVTVDISTRPPVEFLQFWRVRLRPRPDQPAEVLLGRGRPLGDVVVSEDAEWFAFVELPGSGVPRLRLVNAGVMSEAALNLEEGISDFEDERESSFGWSDPRFRPGRNEIWALGPGGKLAILRADGGQTVHLPPTPVRRAPGSMEWANDRLDFYRSELGSAFPRARSMFSADGRWWVYREGDQVHLGDADDPAAPSRLHLPAADAPGVADIQGQNRLAMWSTVGSRGVQLHLHVADSLALLDSFDEVRQAVVGARGTLALTGYQGRDASSLTPGTLLLGALGAGRQPVVIGRNVTQFALLNGCSTCDPVAAGTRLAYTVHARVPWKYDGLWVGELP